MIAGGAAQRAIAGLLSLALVSGGLVVPSVANAAGGNREGCLQF